MCVHHPAETAEQSDTRGCRRDSNSQRQSGMKGNKIHTGFDIAPASHAVACVESGGDPSQDSNVRFGRLGDAGKIVVEKHNLPILVAH